MPKRYWWVIITYIIMQFSSILIVPFLYYVFQVDLVKTSIYYSVFSFIVGLIIVLLLMKPDMQKVSHRNASPWGIAILWSIVGVFMAFSAQFIAVAIEMEVFGIKPGSENTKQIMDISRNFPIFILIPAILAPILEEIIFRKIIFGSLYKRTNFLIAALGSAFIFGIIHGEPEHILIYASMGLVFAFLYVQTKRIMVPIIVHMAMNSITVINQFNLTPEQIEEMERQINQLQMIFIGG